MGWAFDRHYHTCGCSFGPLCDLSFSGPDRIDNQLAAVSRPRNRCSACFTFGQDHAHLGVEPCKGAETLNAHRY